MIKGKITGLRALEEEDLAMLQEWRNNPLFRKNFREHKELSSFHQKFWYERTIKNPNDFMFAIVDLKDNSIIGACGLLYTNWILRSADFSFYLGKDDLYMDDLYAPDAIQTLIKYGFEDLNLNKIWMELYEYDHLKFDFFTKEMGFSVDGVLRDNAFFEGKYWNSHIISLLLNDYLMLPNV